MYTNTHTYTHAHTLTHSLLEEDALDVYALNNLGALYNDASAVAKGARLYQVCMYHVHMCDMCMFVYVACVCVRVCVCMCVCVRV